MLIEDTLDRKCLEVSCIFWGNKTIPTHVVVNSDFVRSLELHYRNSVRRARNTLDLNHFKLTFILRVPNSSTALH